MGSNLTPGRHTLNVKARDAGGNEGEQSHSWFVGKCSSSCTLSISCHTLINCGLL
jgi:hypothetical protein